MVMSLVSLVAVEGLVAPRGLFFPGDARKKLLWASNRDDDVARRRAVVVGVEASKAKQRLSELEDSLAELAELAASADLEVVGRVVCREVLESSDIAAVRAELEARARPCDEQIVALFDEELSPEEQRRLERELQVSALGEVFALPPNKKKVAMERQARALVEGYDKHAEKKRRRRERAVAVRVVDRTAVVLELFARRASTREGRLQVALAQTLYRTPRLSRLAFKFAVDGDEMGSTKAERRRTMENDQKMLRQRAATLRRKIAALRSHRARTRLRRRRNGSCSIALVGYANAGKSSLLAALASADATVDAKPFATLDPLTRRVRLGAEGPTALVSDTVGFVSKLPAQLSAAFRATLEEVSAADVVVHVVDASAPRQLLKDRARIVENELSELGVDAVPRVIFYNKCDALPADRASNLAHLAASKADRVVLGSAKLGLGLDHLKTAIAARLFNDDSLVRRRVDLVIPWNANAGAIVADLRARADIRRESHDAHALYIDAIAPLDLAAKLKPYAILDDERRPRRPHPTARNSSENSQDDGYSQDDDDDAASISLPSS